MSNKNKMVFRTLQQVGEWNAQVLQEWMTEYKNRRYSKHCRPNGLESLPLAYLKRGLCDD